MHIRAGLQIGPIYAPTRLPEKEVAPSAACVRLPLPVRRPPVQRSHPLVSAQPAVLFRPDLASRRRRDDHLGAAVGKRGIFSFLVRALDVEGLVQVPVPIVALRGSAVRTSRPVARRHEVLAAGHVEADGPALGTFNWKIA